MPLHVDVCKDVCLFWQNHPKHVCDDLDKEIFNGSLKGRYRVDYHTSKIPPTTTSYSIDKEGERIARISLAPRLSLNYKELKGELCHQMCHVGAWILDNQRGHGDKWCEYVGKITANHPEVGRLCSCDE